MYPTVSVKYILWYILCMNTIDWIAYVLSCSHNQAESGQHKYGDAVVEAKNWWIDVYVADFD